MKEVTEFERNKLELEREINAYKNEADELINKLTDMEDKFRAIKRQLTRLTVNHH